LHFFLNTADNFVRTPRQEEYDLVDHRPIVLLRLRENARRLAALDVVVEARALRHLRRHVVIAAAHGEDLFHDVERAPHCTDVSVGAKVAGPIVFQTSRYKDSRERLLDRDFDVRIRLIVAQRDVEARPIFLDEIRFQNERVCFSRHHDCLEVADEPYEMTGFYALELIVREIAPHAPAEALRLSDVEASPIPSLPQIDPRSFGKVR